MHPALSFYPIVTLRSWFFFHVTSWNSHCHEDHMVIFTLEVPLTDALTSPLVAMMWTEAILYKMLKRSCLFRNQFSGFHTPAIMLTLASLFIIDKAESELKIHSKGFERKWSWCFCLTVIVAWHVPCLCLILAQKTLSGQAGLTTCFSLMLEEDRERFPQLIGLHLGIAPLRNDQKNGSEDKRCSLLCAEMANHAFPKQAVSSVWCSLQIFQDKEKAPDSFFLLPYLLPSKKEG